MIWSISGHEKVSACDPYTLGKQVIRLFSSAYLRNLRRIPNAAAPRARSDMDVGSGHTPQSAGILLATVSNPLPVRKLRFALPVPGNVKDAKADVCLQTPFAVVTSTCAQYLSATSIVLRSRLRLGLRGIGNLRNRNLNPNRNPKERHRL